MTKHIASENDLNRAVELVKQRDALGDLLHKLHNMHVDGRLYFATAGNECGEFVEVPVWSITLVKDEVYAQIDKIKAKLTEEFGIAQ